MKSRLISLTRILLACLLASTLFIGGCASTDRRGDSEDPDDILAQARQAYFQQEYEEVFKLLFPLAVAGNARAQYTLGYLYHHGLGVVKNDQQAMQWIQRAAAQGNEKALEALR